MTSTAQPGLKGRECKHVVYVTAQDGSPNDLLVVKEYEHYEDGRVVPNLRFIQNFKRPFWITKEGFRNHHDKKEWEHVSRLQRHESTQYNLVKSICRAMGRAPTKTDMRILCRSPYIYGTDISSPALVKQHYMKTWPTCLSDNRVALLDIETDVIEGHEEPIMCALTMKEKAHLIVTNAFFDGVPNPEEKIRAVFQRELGEIIEKRGIQLKITFVKDAGELAALSIATAHEWQPDFLSIWNMNFDVPRLNKVLERYGYNLAEVWSDPRVPDRYKYFRYVEGQAQKITSSGKTMALHPAEQWHTVHAPASFYVIDSMCVYLKLRIAKGKEQSYALDFILQKQLGIRKLKFAEADHVTGLEWHRLMQRQFKPEYCVYNLFDCFSAEMLDEKTTDLSRMISTMTAFSEYHRFPSQPRRTCDDLHFFCLENGRVAASTSDKMENEFDQMTVGLEDWIVTLPSHLVHDDGLKCLKELPDVSTNIRVHVADLDIEGTYPNEQVVMNISKETTSREMCRIEGVNESLQRAMGIQLSGGYVNAVEICCELFKAPTLDRLLLAFRETMPKSRAKPDLLRALQEEETKTLITDDPEVEIAIPPPVPMSEMEVLEREW